MNFKYLLLAAALFVACGDDSSSTPVNDSPAKEEKIPADLSYTDCIQTVFESFTADYSLYGAETGGLVIDSMYWDKGDANNRGKSIYTYKAYWTGTHLDSTFESNLRDGEWSYRTVLNTKKATVTKNGNITTFTLTDNGNTDTRTVYFDGDSLAISHMEDGENYTSIYVLKNDTIFRPTQDEFIAKDENDINTCYLKENYGGELVVRNRYETGVKNGMIFLTRTYIEDGLEGKIATFFMFRR